MLLAFCKSKSEGSSREKGTKGLTGQGDSAKKGSEINGKES